MTFCRRTKKWTTRIFLNFFFHLNKNSWKAENCSDLNPWHSWYSVWNITTEPSQYFPYQFEYLSNFLNCSCPRLWASYFLFYLCSFNDKWLESNLWHLDVIGEILNDGPSLIAKCLNLFKPTTFRTCSQARSLPNCSYGGVVQKWLWSIKIYLLICQFWWISVWLEFSGFFCWDPKKGSEPRLSWDQKWVSA